MCNKYIGLAAVLSISLFLAVSAPSFSQSGLNGYRNAVTLYENGMYSQARSAFDDIYSATDDVNAKAYSALCSIKMRDYDYETVATDFLGRFPYSVLADQVRFEYAGALFEVEDYEDAIHLYESIQASNLNKSQYPEYQYNRSYCNFALGYFDFAENGFLSVLKQDSEYGHASEYALGYINYERKNFVDAVSWFASASADENYSALCDYYIVDSKFMLKEYDYVTEVGPVVMEEVTEDLGAHLSRIISESWLVKGDTEKALSYYDMSGNGNKTRGDYFFAGSLLYAAGDWAGAVENYSQMTDRTDSLGQIANYNLGFSSIQVKDRVSALRAFKEASDVTYDPVITEDAYFNFAKLAFDLNNDSAPFQTYLDRYPEHRDSDRIYSYIAVASLRSRDYAAAVEAFNNIDELDDDMHDNFMKTNYLRATQLVDNNSWKDAVECLRASSIYAEKYSSFWQLSQFWLAESYFHSGEYDKAIQIFSDLHNHSAFEGDPEGDMIQFGIAYSNFKKGDYVSAARWFDRAASIPGFEFADEAVLRKGDCLFMRRNYTDAAKVYSDLASIQNDPDQVYPYYQAGICYGLLDRNQQKNNTLLPVMQASPSSRFYSDALYELGRSYVSLKEDGHAEECFDLLLNTSSDSTYMARSLLELAMISRNRLDNEKAMEYYKKVVETMPLTEFVTDALNSIELLYQNNSDPDGYFAYLDNVGMADFLSGEERETMYFNSAVQSFFSGDYEKALANLLNFEESYPSGQHQARADYYIAESYKYLSQPEPACDYYLKVIGSDDVALVESSKMSLAGLYFGMQRFSASFVVYQDLCDSSENELLRKDARLGRMRSAYRARQFDDALTAADEIIADTTATGNVMREAYWTVAKSYLSSSRRDEALPVLESLAQNPETEEGAEACYLLIHDRFNSGKFGEVENMVYDFSESAVTSDYWLAKAYILLGDAYLERGFKTQAKATYQSIVDGYTPSGSQDDVLDTALSRIASLK